jgi:hypothetical protein
VPITQTEQKLADITDEGYFEKLATAVLREADTDCAAVIHTGVNTIPTETGHNRPQCKGAFGPLPRRKARKPRKESAFLPVRVVPAAPVLSSRSVTCRLVHPGGWVLECDGLPPAAWISAVLAGEAHDAT